MTELASAAPPIDAPAANPALPPAESAPTAPAAGSEKSSPDPSPDSATRDAAKLAFEHGVTMADRGDYVAAKQSFLEAYRLVPHPIVAYNAALACIALGERQEALRLLDRALEPTAGGAMPVERAAIEAARRRLNDGAAEPSAREGPVSPIVGPLRSATGTPSNARTPPPAAPRPIAPSTFRPAPSRSDRTTLRYVLGATGAVLLLGSGAIYLWNDGRHGTWSVENAALENERDRLLDAGQTPSQNAELRRRVEANDDLLSSIHRFDVIDVSMLATGVVALGVTGYLMLTADRGQLRAASSPGRFKLEYSF